MQMLSWDLFIKYQYEQKKGLSMRIFKSRMS